eukprot:3735473-Rhodomonas_salina.2
MFRLSKRHLLNFEDTDFLGPVASSVPQFHFPGPRQWPDFIKPGACTQVHLHPGTCTLIQTTGRVRPQEFLPAYPGITSNNS